MSDRKPVDGQLCLVWPTGATLPVWIASWSESGNCWVSLVSKDKKETFDAWASLSEARAARDLLEACKAVVAAGVLPDLDSAPRTVRVESVEAARKVHAAIAKAEVRDERRPS